MTKVNNKSTREDLLLNFLTELLQHLQTCKQKRTLKKPKKAQIYATDGSTLKITFLQIVFKHLLSPCLQAPQGTEAQHVARRPDRPWAAGAGQTFGRTLAGFPAAEQSPRASPWILYLNRALLGKHGKFPGLSPRPWDILRKAGKRQPVLPPRGCRRAVQPGRCGARARGALRTQPRAARKRRRFYPSQRDPPALQSRVPVARTALATHFSKSLFLSRSRASQENHAARARPQTAEFIHCRV